MPTTDARILAKFFEIHHASRKNYSEGARVLWRGENYVLIRTGLGNDNSRDVYLVDRAGLTVNSESTPLTQLAAGYHPYQSEAAARPTLIHCSRSDAQEENETPLRGRWCKQRLREAIAIAERAEATYDADFQDRAAAHEAKERIGEEKAAREVAFLESATGLVTAQPDCTPRYGADRYAVRGRYEVQIFESDETFRISALHLSFGEYRKFITAMGFDR